jgi:hypothetical protein
MLAKNLSGTLEVFNLDDNFGTFSEGKMKAGVA